MVSFSLGNPRWNRDREHFIPDMWAPRCLIVLSRTCCRMACYLRWGSTLFMAYRRVIFKRMRDCLAGQVAQIGHPILLWYNTQAPRSSGYLSPRSAVTCPHRLPADLPASVISRGCLLRRIVPWLVRRGFSGGIRQVRLSHGLFRPGSPRRRVCCARWRRRCVRSSVATRA